MAVEAMATELTRRRFTVDEYDRMGQAGLFRDERVELLDGEVVVMSPIGERHIATVMHLDRLLQRRLVDRALVSVQSPLRLGAASEPEPDVAVLRPDPDGYYHRKPAERDALLIVEVAESSRDHDRTVKSLLYARVGIAETWIVLLDSLTIEVRRDPGPEGYRDVRAHAGDAPLSPLAFPDVTLPARSLFPPGASA